jgi:Leucine-rich repeat (LRR) protein
MTNSNENEEEKNYCEICMDDEKTDCISPNQCDTEFKSYCSHSACTDCWRSNKSGKCFYCQTVLPYNFPPKTDEEIEEAYEYLMQFVCPWDNESMEIHHPDLNYFDFYVQNLTVIPTHFPNIKKLTIYMGNVCDLGPFRGLTQLTELDLFDNKVSDLSPLSPLTGLMRLHLGNNDVSDLRPLSGLTNLTYLILDGNPISNVDPIRGLTNLQYLGLSYNNVPNFDIVHDLPNLHQIYVSGYDNYDTLPVRDGLLRYF